MSKIVEAIGAMTGPDDGAAAVEYAIVVSLIIAVMVVAVGMLGLATNGLFCDTVEKLNLGGLVGSCS